MFYGLCVTQRRRLVLTGDEIRDPKQSPSRLEMGYPGLQVCPFSGKQSWVPASWQKEENDMEQMLLYLDQENVNVQETGRAVTGKIKVFP